MAGSLDVRPIWRLFVALGEVAQETRLALARGLVQSDQPLTPADQQRLSLALGHLGDVHEGFALTLRTAAVRSPSELRDLACHILLDWSWLSELGLSWEGGQPETPAGQVLAFAHATIALGILPQLPPELVTYPGSHRSYADIPAPRTPGEVLARIEELEQVVWEAAERPVADVQPDPLRRTYGFFETSAWLVSQHLHKITH
jgi:hypothetical protein